VTGSSAGRAASDSEKSPAACGNYATGGEPTFGRAPPCREVETSPGRGIRGPGNAEAREPLAQFPGFDAAYFLTPGSRSSSGNHPVGMMPRQAVTRTIASLP